MTDLENLISRYLDGELSGAPLVELRRLLEESPDARTTLREMLAISRSARITPQAHTPQPWLERQLFAQLNREGLYAPEVLESARTAETVATAETRLASLLARRVPHAAGAVAAAVMVFLAFLGTPLDQLGNVSPGNLTAPAIVRTSVISDGPLAAVPTMRTGPSSGFPVNQPPVLRTNSLRTNVLQDGGDKRSIAELPVAPALRSTDTISSESSHPSAPLLKRSVLPLLADESTSRLGVAFPIPADQISPNMETGVVRDHFLSASLRVGGSVIDRGSNESARDMSLRVDAQLGGGHQLGLIVSSGVTVTEQRAQNTHTVAAPSTGTGGKKSDQASLMRHEDDVPTYALSTNKEVWGGVSYAYQIAGSPNWDFSVGTKAGLGPRTWRVGAELPVRYHVGSRIALEFVPSVTHVSPHDFSTSEYTIDNAKDGYLYQAEESRRNFTTIGLELGVRVAIR